MVSDNGEGISREGEETTQLRTRTKCTVGFGMEKLHWEGLEGFRRSIVIHKM